MIGGRMEMPFPTRDVRRPSPTGVGSMTSRYVQIDRIVEEMADPARAITERVRQAEQTLAVQPVADQQAGYL